MRLTLLLPVLVAAAALLAVPAIAKEGVRARLDDPVRLGAAAGETIRFTWHLVDEKERPFNASGIYLRISRCGRAPMTVPAKRASGGYSARVRVPKGGIRKVLVGLEGWRITGERKERADRFFQFDPPLARSCS